MNATPNSVYAAALVYISCGFSIIPVKPNGKAPDCRHGKDDASLDPDQVATWFASRGDRNIGIVTGRSSLIAVLDIDPRNGGLESFERFQADFEALPSTLIVATGGGGFHHYLRLSEAQSQVLRDRHPIPGYPGLDLQCGGYVVAPPSTHPSGGRYSWT